MGAIKTKKRVKAFFLRLQENYEYFQIKKQTAPVVQWIEQRFPVPSIGVRLPAGVHWRMYFGQKYAAKKNPHPHVCKYATVADFFCVAFLPQNPLRQCQNPCFSLIIAKVASRLLRVEFGVRRELASPIAVRGNAPFFIVFRSERKRASV